MTDGTRGTAPVSTLPDSPAPVSPGPPPSSSTDRPAGHGSAAPNASRRLGHLRPELLVRSQRPGVIPLTRLGLGDALDGALRTMRGTPQCTIGLALLTGAAFIIPATAFVAVLDGLNILGEADEGLVALLAPVAAGLAAVLLLSGFLAPVLHEAAFGRKLRLGTWWAAVRPRAWSLLGTVALSGAILAAALAVLVIPFLVLAYAVGGWGSLFAGVLVSMVLVPWSWWWTVRLGFAPAVAAVEGTGPWRAVRRSWVLTRRVTDWLRLLLWTGAATLLAGVALLLIVFALILAGFLVSHLFLVDVAVPEAVWSALGDLLTPGIVLLIVSLGAPYLAGVVSLAYLDRRFAYEGYDVHMVRAFQDRAEWVSRR